MTMNSSPTPSSVYDEPIWDNDSLAIIDQTESDFIASQSKLTSPAHLIIECEEEEINPNPSTRPSTPPSQQLERIELSSPMKKKQIDSISWVTKTLYQRYRERRGFLSVSDIVSCAWCETQVEYGLLGRRYLPPAKRPKSFKTSSGKEIKVDTQLMVSRQKVLDGGTAVHNKLEKEVAPEKVEVLVETALDSWGLKILNTIINLSLLRTTGLTREMSVWGFVGDFLVLGIIDQLELEPKPASSRARTSRPGTLDHFVKRPVEDNSQSEAQAQQGSSTGPLVMISDSKTRQGTTLPPFLYTQSTRYQLMLYKFLYDQLASRSLDWTKLSSHLDLDLDQAFSPTFILQTTLILEDHVHPEIKFSAPQNLREMIELLNSHLAHLGVSDHKLEIVYRTRDVAVKGRKKKKFEHDNTPSISTQMLQPVVMKSEEEQLAQAIANSLVDVPPPTVSQAEAIRIATELSLASSGTAEGTTPPLAESVEACTPITDSVSDEQQTKASTGPKRSLINSSDPSHDSNPDVKPEAGNPSVSYARKGKGIIGSVWFDYDHSELQRFVGDALAFWNGDREPRGVPVTEIDRCGPCEFQSGCEWRAKKAGEVLALAEDTLMKQRQMGRIVDRKS